MNLARESKLPLLYILKNTPPTIHFTSHRNNSTSSSGYPMMSVFSSAKSYSGISRFNGAGPFRARPATMLETGSRKEGKGEKRGKRAKGGEGEGGYRYHSGIRGKDRTILRSRLIHLHIRP